MAKVQTTEWSESWLAIVHVHNRWFETRGDAVFVVYR